MVHQPHSKLHQKQLKTGNNCMFDITMVGKRSLMMMGLRGGHCKANKRVGTVRCSGIGIEDFIGGDLVNFDLGQWLSDVEEHKALAIYTPHEGGYEGLGVDPQTTPITKIHPCLPFELLTTCPYTLSTMAHLGKQPIARWYFPPEVDYRLDALPPDAKGLVVWIIEAKDKSTRTNYVRTRPCLRPPIGREVMKSRLTNQILKATLQL
ncbi:hypothetical protein I3842_13G060800 [Carya illinoinensis]|uniref:Uncharacterized protein n=1 Tax=Carya illinoinensis TaxID=32201 RepID=A0A922AHN9_CARIL|nr:hypothetical protein I3842_13G060800 [Carya illinoinensis]